ncbi:MAG: alpha/beta hydrolase domain-containing protein [Acidobacteriota bacterium]|nr:alpha/beta hydrolase domain-containing protein [Acidobacteriota bacterium]
MRRALFLFLIATPLLARVQRVDVTRSDLGPHFEKLVGKVYFAVDPKNPHNAIIADLDKAPRNAAGEVEFSADLYVIRPKTNRNDTLFVEISNRGGKAFLANLDPASEADIRDRFLFDRGYTVAWIGWQFDVRPEPNRVRLYAPIAPGITGEARSDFVVAKKVDEHPVGHMIQGTIGGTGYPAADINERAATLTEREAPTARRRTIPRKQWRFKDATTIMLDGGFVPGKIYEVIYTAKDPAIVGCGLAAVRDFVAYSKYDPKAETASQRAYGFGISQSGRFLRHFVYEGFNADEQGRQVFDAIDAHVAGAGRGNFNHRFAQPSRDAQPLSPLFYRVDLFPFADLPTTDPLSGKSEGLLDRATAEKVVPKIFYTNTSYEYWSRGESLCHTTPDGTRDVPLPDTSRIYFIAGTAHVPGPFPPQKREGQNLDNPSNYWAPLHALFEALDAWVRNGIEPPPSRYPHISDGTLVPAAQLAVKFPVMPYQPYKLDLGGEPPRVLGNYPALVPQVGADGNETSGIRSPRVTVPLATYTGWNLRDASVGFPEARQSFTGSFIPFTPARILEIYHDAYDYLGRCAVAAMRLIDERFLVPEELNPTLKAAERDWLYALEGER